MSLLFVVDLCGAIKDPKDIAVSADGKRVVTVEYGSLVKLWDFDTRKVLWKVKAKGGHRTWMGWLSGTDKADISPDGSLVAFADEYDDRVVVLDSATHNILKIISQDGKEPVNLAFTPDGKYLIAIFKSGVIKSFHIQTNTVKTLVKRKKESFYSVAISSDSKYIATSGWNKKDKCIVTLWDLKSGKKLHTYKGHKETIYDVAISPDGKWIASASRDNTFIVWNLQTENILHKVKTHLGGSFPSVDRVLFTNDSKFLITAGSDKQIKIWDFKTPKEILSYHTKGCVRGIDIPDSGDIMLVASKACSTSESFTFDTFESFEVPFFSAKYDIEMEDIYKKVKQSNSIEEYGKFLDKYNNEINKYYSQRVERIAAIQKALEEKIVQQMEEIRKDKKGLIAYIDSKYVAKKSKEEALQALYVLVEEKNAIDEYVWFLDTYPKASQIKKAQQKLYELVEKQNNIAGYEWFIKTYPKAPQVKEAIANMHKLAFEKAKNIDSITAYNTFIISYPMAQEVREANELAKDLERYKYTDALPSWFRSIMPDFLADIFNAIFGIFSNDEKKSRALLIKAKQIERQGNEYYGDKKAGYVMITNRMYDLLQEEYNDTDATLRFLESEEFKDFVRTFKSVMRSMNDRLNDISRYSSEILEVSKQGFSEANTDRDMSAYYTKQHREWEKNMHLRDKGYK
jgi:DNA-binding beta-propeller fold protein YncE